MQVKFIAPCRILISGVSNSGKTCLVSQIIKNKDQCFTPQIQRVIYCTKYIKSIPKEIKNDVEAFSGIPTQNLIENLQTSTQNALIVIDDLAHEALSNQDIQSLFTTGRHVGLSVILLLQNFYNKEKFSRDVTLNSNYIIIMNNNRDASSIMPLSFQLSPLQPRSMANIYFKECVEPFSYILIDISTHIPSILKYRTSLFDGFEKVFLTSKQLERLRQEGTVQNNNYEIKLIENNDMF